MHDNDPRKPRPEAVAQTGATIVIPAYNEEGAIEATIEQVHETMGKTDFTYEILIVDDGSRDQTAELCKKAKARVITHEINRGYGEALKTGIREATHPWVLITDADGTYPIDRIPDLLKKTDLYDMVVGARTGDEVHVPFVRRPAKWFITKLASTLTGQKIPDLNSGLRVFSRDLAMRFMSLYPKGFSFTSTITMSSLCNNYDVLFIPINYFERVGKSAISPLKDFTGFIILIIRISALFRPLRVFMPPATLLGLGGLLTGGLTNPIGTGLLVGGINLAFLGLLADVVVRRTRF